jgi:hypothetical protein
MMLSIGSTLNPYKLESFLYKLSLVPCADWRLIDTRMLVLAAVGTINGPMMAKLG